MIPDDDSFWYGFEGGWYDGSSAGSGSGGDDDTCVEPRDTCGSTAAGTCQTFHQTGPGHGDDKTSQSDCEWAAPGPAGWKFMAGWVSCRGSNMEVITCEWQQPNDPGNVAFRH